MKNSGSGLLLIAAFFLLFLASSAAAATVEYDLDIGYKSVDYTGRKVTAIAVNGAIPGPVLRFTEGDHAVIRVTNHLKEETSVHWHGILLPNQYDGVPYVTTMPILPGQSHTFVFDLKHAGTYWYHSHTNLQEQAGLYGAIVIQPRKKRIRADHDIVLMLSDWTDEDPLAVLRTLKRGDEWYSIKKGTAQSWDRVIRNHAVTGRLRQSFMRMPPMDVSDIAYDRFLANGRPRVSFPEVKPGETVRLRVINGAASSYFRLTYGNGMMKVISADGMDVEPLWTSELPIAVAETYDLLLSAPEDGAVELRATAVDGSGFASAVIGRGKVKEAPAVRAPDPFRMMRSGHRMAGMEMGRKAHAAPALKQGMMHAPPQAGGKQAGLARSIPSGLKRHSRGLFAPDAETRKTRADTLKQAGFLTRQAQKDLDPGIAEGAYGNTSYESGRQKKGGKFTYARLRSLHPTTMPPGRKLREVVLNLTGNMDRYQWSINNIPLSEADKIVIRKGEVVRFRLVNKTMMAHPMHLHGHFFRVINGQGDYSPLKHTVNVEPMATTVIEFLASEDKDWFFHCHILYHLMSGMARVVHYAGSEIDPALAAAKKRSRTEIDDDHFFAWGEADIASHMNSGELKAANNRNEFGLEWDSDWKDAWEVSPWYGRYFGRFLTLFIGGDFDDEEKLGVAGVRYVLPLYIEAELRVDDNGDFRLAAASEVQILPRLSFTWSADTDDNWRYSLEWRLGKGLSLFAGHDSDYDAGAGVRVRF